MSWFEAILATAILLIIAGLVYLLTGLEPKFTY